MIFPDWGSAGGETETAELPLFTEWAMDWETNSFALRDGAPYLVSGTEALKIWVRRALHPESGRFLFSAYSPDYGNSIALLMGEGGDSGILENRLRREIRETLLVSPYLTAVDGFSFERKGGAVTVRFTVHTVYEEFEEEVHVS